MNASLQLLRQAVPSVVHLEARVPERHPSSAILGGERMATGTIVDRDGLVLTLNYVVLGARRIDVTFWDGGTSRAEVVGRDFGSGLALLRLADPVPLAAQLRPSTSMSVGDDAFVIASAGAGAMRASSGGVSGVGPFDAYWEYLLDRGVRVTVANPGLGGGPLFDRAGRMVAAVALNLNEVGRLALAIPVELFLDERDALVATGRPANAPSRPWLGVYCAVHGGRVVIAGLMPGGPGEAAGLRPGDVIRAVEDVEVTSRAHFYRELWSQRSGDRVTLEVVRDDRRQTVKVPTVDVEEMFA